MGIGPQSEPETNNTPSCQNDKNGEGELPLR